MIPLPVQGAIGECIRSAHALFGSSEIDVLGSATTAFQQQVVVSIFDDETECARLGNQPVQACIAKIAGNMISAQSIESLAEASWLNGQDILGL